MIKTLTIAMLSLAAFAAYGVMMGLCVGLCKIGKRGDCGDKNKGRKA